MNKRPLLGLIALCIAVTTGCSLYVATLPPTIHIEEVDDPRASIGQLVQVRWRYLNGDKIVLQKYVLVQHTILGAVRSEHELELSDRDLSFIFEAPTTVFIKGYESDGAGSPATEVAVDILYDTDYFLRATVEVTPPQTNTTSTALARLFPRLGYPADTAFLDPPRRNIEFSNFLAIRDVDGDGLIEFFNNGAFGLDPAAPFRMISDSRTQADGFAPRQGSGFPILCVEALVPDTCHDAIDLPPLLGVANAGTADALAFGGALAFEATQERIKTDDGDDITVWRNPGGEGEPIFIAIALRSRLNSGFLPPDGELEIVDMSVGNVPQGLALSVFRGESPIDASLGQRSAGYVIGGPGGSAVNGDIKGAFVTDVLNVAAQAAFVVRFGFQNVEWNVPLRNDDDLLGTATARFLCEIDGVCP